MVQAIQPLLSKARFEESRAMEPLRKSHQAYTKFYNMEAKGG